MKALAAIKEKPSFPDRLISDPLEGTETDAIGRYNEQRLRAAAARDPLDFRAQHRVLTETGDPVIERLPRALPDSRGGIGNPHRSYDTLAILLRNGTIAAEAFDAGRRFEEDFALAQLDPLHASNPSRIRVQGSESLTDRAVAGRRRVQSALTAMGGLSTPAGSAVWEILGLGRSVKEWAGSCQFGQQGRSLDEKVAKGIFLAALGLLAAHYGKSKRG